MGVVLAGSFHDAVHAVAVLASVEDAGSILAHAVEIGVPYGTPALDTSVRHDLLERALISTDRLVWVAQAGDGCAEHVLGPGHALEPADTLKVIGCVIVEEGLGTHAVEEDLEAHAVAVSLAILTHAHNSRGHRTPGADAVPAVGVSAP